MSTLTRSGLRATMGTPYKLISPKGTLLGVLTVPDHIADGLTTYDSMKFIVRRPLRRDYLAIDQPSMGAVTDFGVIARSRHYEFGRDGVQIHGVSLEELEKQPGWTFSPSAGYLRSLLTE